MPSTRPGLWQERNSRGRIHGVCATISWNGYALTTVTLRSSLNPRLADGGAPVRGRYLGQLTIS